MEGREPKVDGKWFARKDARPRRSGPVRFIRTCLVLFAILYLGVWLLGFTAGFRSYLEDDLQRRLGLPVKIRKARLTPDLNLVVEGLATEGSGRKGQPGVAVQKGRLEWTLLDAGRWHWPRLRRIQIEGCSLAFAPAEQGGWAPTALTAFSAQVADWGGFGLPTPKPAPPPVDLEPEKTAPAKPAKPANVLDQLRHCVLDLDDGRMVWWNEDGRELASAQKIRLAVTPLALPNRLMIHGLLTVDEAHRTDGRRARNFRFEFLDLRGQQIVLELKADWTPTGAPPAGAADGIGKPPAVEPGK